MSSVAYRYYKTNMAIKAYTIVSLALFVAGIILIIICFGTPVDWKLLLGIIFISRASVLEHKKDILVVERNKLRDQL